MIRDEQVEAMRQTVNRLLDSLTRPIGQSDYRTVVSLAITPVESRDEKGNLKTAIRGKMVVKEVFHEWVDYE